MVRALRRRYGTAGVVRDLRGRISDEKMPLHGTVGTPGVHLLSGLTVVRGIGKFRTEYEGARMRIVYGDQVLPEVRSLDPPQKVTE
jgi:hypothetical protein